MDLAYHGNWLFQLLFGCGKKTNLVFYLEWQKENPSWNTNICFSMTFFSAVVLYYNCTFQ